MRRWRHVSDRILAGVPAVILSAGALLGFARATPGRRPRRRWLMASARAETQA